jgi:glycosyltransferase involved in cell wall biosynthesis
MLRTAVCLARRRPGVLIVQCPSVVLSFWAALLKPVFRYSLIADLHNEAVEPFMHSFPLYRALLRSIHRASDLCVVTNDALKAVVENAGGRAFVLPDKVPDISPVRPRHSAVSPYRVVFVCTYARDEPYLDVIEAARRLGPSVEMYITGDHRRLEPSPEVPHHVHLTGFLPELEYEKLLRTADVIMDLTRMDNCLLCGAYEAVAVEKPLVTSDTRALREYFRRGTVYSSHDAESLAASVTQALSQYHVLADEMTTLKRELNETWAIQHHALIGMLERQSQETNAAALQTKPGLPG